MQRRYGGVGYLAVEAGFGTRVWSYYGYLTTRYYHFIMAVFISAILFLVAAPHLSIGLTLLIVSIYLLYFALRKILPANLEAILYQPQVQYLRAQVGMWALFFLLWLIPSHNNRLDVWPLFLPILLIVSYHCSTLYYVTSVVQACVMLFIGWWGWRSFAQIGALLVVDGSRLILACMCLTFMAFIIHYLTRNISARNDMIDSFEAIEALIEDKRDDNLPSERWRMALETYLNIVKGSCGSIWVCDHNTQRIRPLVGLRHCVSHDCPIYPDECDKRALALAADHPISKVVRTGQPTFCVSAGLQENETGVRGKSIPTCQLGSDMFSRIVVPIKNTELGREQIIGVLCIDFKRETSPRPDLIPDYYDFLSGLTQRVRPILHHFQKIEELRALQHIGQRVSSSLIPKVILEDALDAIVDTLGFQFATISLVDQEVEMIRTAAGRNVPAEWIEAAAHSLGSSDIQADVIRQARQEVLSGWDPRFDQEIWQNFNHQELIRVFTPVAGKSHIGEYQIIGTIEAGYNTAARQEISDEQLRMLNVLAQQLFAAIDKANLYERTKQRAESLDNLHRIGWEVALGRDLAAVLDDVGNTIQNILRADMVMLYRYNHHSGSLEYPAIFGDIIGNSPLRLPAPNVGVVATILTNREPYYAVDAQNDPLLIGSPPLEGHRPFTKRQNIISFAGVPMIAGGQSIGVLCINYRKRHTFSESERQVLEIAAQFAATALHNAEVNELTEELITSRERMKLAIRLHDSLSQYLPAIRFMVETAQFHLNRDSENVATQLKKIRTVTLKASNEIRANIFELNTKGLAQANLDDALTEYAQEAKDFFNLDVDLLVELGSEGPHLPLSIKREVLMVCREGITNVAKYAQTKHMSLTVRVQLQIISLCIADKGCGFEVKSQLDRQGRHGLNMMQQRINNLKGRLHINSNPGKGTIIQVEIPLF